MPFIRKRRIWWESVPEATSYVVYASKDSEVMDPAKFSWGNTPSIISKQVKGKTELIIPNEWPEFPVEPGSYYLAITSKDDAENESDPFLLSGVFKLVAPPTPPRGGIEILSLVHPEPARAAPPFSREGRIIIEKGLEEVKNNKEVWDAYLGGE
jgi:hypothetical protein